MDMKVVYLCLIASISLCCPEVYSQNPILYSPNGGEKLVAGSSYTIRWGGKIPNDIFSLDYSTNSGTSWLPIADNLSGVSYVWNPVPATVSNNCRVKLSVSRDVKTDSILFYQPDSKDPSDAARSAELSPDASTIITGDQDGWVREYDVLTKQILWQKQLCTDKTTDDPNNYIMKVRYSVQGDKIVTYTAEDSIIILSTKTGKEIIRWYNTIKSYPARITERSCAFNPDGSKLAVSTFKTVRLYNTIDGALINETSLSDGGVDVLEWSNDNQSILAGMASGSIYFINPANAAVVKKVTIAPPVRVIEFSPDNSLLATASFNDGKVDIWDMKDTLKKYTVSLLNPVGSISVKFSHDNKSFFVSGERVNGSIYAIIERNSTDGSFLSYSAYARAGLGQLTINPTEDKFACLNWNGAVILQRPGVNTNVLTDISDGDFSITGNLVPKDTVELYVPKIRCNAGEMVSVPVKLRGGGAYKADGITVTLLVNSHIVFPTTHTSQIRSQSTIREIPLLLPNLADKDSTLLYISCQSMLSTDTVSTLVLENPQPVNGTTVITVLDGELRTNICREGSPRLFDGSKILSLQVVGGDIVNSSSIKGTFSTIEDGKLQLILFDLYGREIEKYTYTNSTKIGEYAFNFDMDSRSNGIYFILLKTNTGSIKKTIHVVQ